MWYRGGNISRLQLLIDHSIEANTICSFSYKGTEDITCHFFFSNLLQEIPRIKQEFSGGNFDVLYRGGAHLLSATPHRPDT